MQIHVADILIPRVFTPSIEPEREFFVSFLFPLPLTFLARFLYDFFFLSSFMYQRGSRRCQAKLRKQKEAEKRGGRAPRRPPHRSACQRFLIILFVNDPGPLIGQRDDTNRSFFHTYVCAM